MAEIRNLHNAQGPQKLNERAEGDLRLIRSMMQRTVRFVPMPGWGIIAIGAIGSVTGWIAGGLSGTNWLIAWLAAALLSVIVAVTTSTWQLSQAGRSLFTGNGRRFWLSLAPGFGAGALLTLALFQAGQQSLLPGAWLLLYGTALVAAGEHSVRPVTWMGCAFLALGTGALFLPWPNLFMGLGFGGLHVLFGLLITRVGDGQ